MLNESGAAVEAASPLSLSVTASSARRTDERSADAYARTATKGLKRSRRYQCDLLPSEQMQDPGSNDEARYMQSGRCYGDVAYNNQSRVPLLEDRVGMHALWKRSRRRATHDTQKRKINTERREEVTAAVEDVNTPHPAAAAAADGSREATKRQRDSTTQSHSHSPLSEWQRAGQHRCTRHTSLSPDFFLFLASYRPVPFLSSSLASLSRHCP